MAPHHAHSDTSRAPRARPALAVAAAAVALITAGCAQSPTPSGSASPSDRAEGSRSASSVPASRDGAPESGRGSAPASTPSSAPASVPSAGGAPSGQASRQAGGFPWCSPGALSASLRGLDAGAGNRYAALVFTNTSQEPCRTRGWPGLQLASEGGTKIPTETQRDRSVTARPFTLKPGDRAWSRLHWTVVPGTGDPASCPEPATLRAIPPDERGSLAADWKLGTVCGGGEIEATALRTGEGSGH